MTDTLIKVEGVSKQFCRSLKKSLWYGMQDLGNELRGRRHGGDGELRPDEFWAVKDVSFELKRGECLGLIGRNGAGKTTLLRMLNGLIKPDRGRIEMRGRVGALIALGAGFNPILTGRENIYVNASVLGLRKKETEAKLEEIVEFSELNEFIDSPVQTYSSGMSVRLGFSIAAIIVRPEVLLLDEVLAVGDIGFTIKCLNTVRALSRDTAVIFVSHNMQYVSAFCTRVMVLDRGSVVIHSEKPAVGIDRYFGLVEHVIAVSGSGGAEVIGLHLMTDEADSREEPVIQQGTDATARLVFRIDDQYAGATVILYIHDEAMAPLVCVPILGSDHDLLHIPAGLHDLDISLGRIDLNAGKYSFVVAVRDATTSVVLTRVQGLRPFRVFSSYTYWGRIVRPAKLSEETPPGESS